MQMHSSNISLHHVATTNATLGHISTMEVDKTHIARVHQLPPTLLNIQEVPLFPRCSKSLYLHNCTILPFLAKSYFKEQGSYDDSDQAVAAPLRPPATERFGQAWQAPQHAHCGLQVSKATEHLSIAITYFF